MHSDTGQSHTRLAVDGRVLDDRYHGIGRITYELIQRLAENPHFRITLFLNRTQRSSRLDVSLLTSSPNVSVKIFDHELTSLAQPLWWPKVLRHNKIDAVLFPYHLGAAVVGGRRRYAIVHDCILEADPSFAPNARARLLYTLWTGLVVRRTSAITPSVASAVAVRRHYGVTVPTSRVVEWGVGQNFADPVEIIDSINGTTLPQKYYLHVGARRPHKNVQQLVRVLAALEPDEHLVLVGSADPRWPDPSTALAERLGVGDRIHTLSGVSEPDLRSLYAGARAFLYPSLIEGFGLPLLEAMAAGLPVVASDIAVFREVAGDAALLVGAFDTAQWVTAIRRLEDSGWRRDIINAGQKRAAVSTWDHAASRMSSILGSASVGMLDL